MFRLRLPRTHVPGREPVWPPLVPHHSQAAGAGEAQAVPPLPHLLLRGSSGSPGRSRRAPTARAPRPPVCFHTRGHHHSRCHRARSPALRLGSWGKRHDGGDVRPVPTQKHAPEAHIHAGAPAGPGLTRVHPLLCLSTSKPLYQLNAPWDSSCVHTTGQAPHGTWALSIPRDRRPPAGAQACLLRARQKLPLPLGAECCSARWPRAVNLGRPGGARASGRRGQPFLKGPADSGCPGCRLTRASWAAPGKGLPRKGPSRGQFCPPAGIGPRL